MTTAPATVAQGLQQVRARIEKAARRAGRDPASVLLIGASSASKGVTLDKFRAAFDAGLRDFGENRIQEAEDRFAELGLRAAEVNWHFIGHLQTNKVSSALRLFSAIHSVDSARLAEQLSRRAATPVKILLEVNIAGEESKYGFAPFDIGAAVSKIGGMPNVELAGLMTVAPAAKDAEAVRPVFRQLRELARANGLTELSMGMTDDFEVAIEEGATMVRVGRAIFAGLA
jgi:pyridoxal phosphate enzyme (YggS family)